MLDAIISKTDESEIANALFKELNRIKMSSKQFKINYIKLKINNRILELKS